MRVRLVPLMGGNPIELQKDIVLVGRHHCCDLRLDHKTVSKLHCVLVKSQGLLLLRDLASTNGCRVNHQKLKRAALLSNDILSIAGFEYRIEICEDSSIPAEVEERPPHIRREATEMIDSRDLDAGHGPIWNDERGEPRRLSINADDEEYEERIPVDSSLAGF
jgi:predicted component of type VI protein secretion system